MQIFLFLRVMGNAQGGDGSELHLDDASIRNLKLLSNVIWCEGYDVSPKILSDVTSPDTLTVSVRDKAKQVADVIAKPGCDEGKEPILLDAGTSTSSTRLPTEEELLSFREHTHTVDPLFPDRNLLPDVKIRNTVSQSSANSCLSVKYKSPLHSFSEHGHEDRDVTDVQRSPSEPVPDPDRRPYWTTFPDPQKPDGNLFGKCCNGGNANCGCSSKGTQWPSFQHTACPGCQLTESVPNHPIKCSCRDSNQNMTLIGATNFASNWAQCNTRARSFSVTAIDDHHRPRWERRASGPLMGPTRMPSVLPPMYRSLSTTSQLSTTSSCDNLSVLMEARFGSSLKMQPYDIKLRIRRTEKQLAKVRHQKEQLTLCMTVPGCDRSEVSRHSQTSGVSLSVLTHVARRSAILREQEQETAGELKRLEDMYKVAVQQTGDDHGSDVIHCAPACPPGCR